MARNPLYSTWSTWQGLITVLLMIAAAMAPIVGAVQIAMRQSKAVWMVIIFAIVIVATLGMIGGIIKLVTPKVAALPSTVKMANFHRRKVRVWAKRWAGSMLAVAALAAVLPGTTKGIAFGLAVILGLLGVVMVFAGYYAARNQDRSLTALESNPWSHWQYSPAQWEAWTDAQVERVMAAPPTFVLRRDWWKLALICVGIGAATFVFGSGRVFNTVFTVVIDAFLIVMVVISTSSNKQAPDKLRTKLGRCVPEAYLGDEGVFGEGVLIPWISADDWLRQAVVDEVAPRNLLLQFEKINALNTAIPTSILNRRVLLPGVVDTDLARLQKELKAKCPAARITIC